jgi:D-lactate dehydrogenase (cytochrome)
LTQLFIGAEGTLGVVTEVTVKLAPVSPTTVAVAQFPSAESACAAVDELLKSHYGMHIRASSFLLLGHDMSLTTAKTFCRMR